MSTLEESVSTPDLSGRTDRAGTGRLARSCLVLAAWLVGSYGPIAATWSTNAANQHGAQVLGAFTLGWAVLLAAGASYRWWGRCLLIGYGFAAVVVTPTIGGTSVVVAFCGVSIAMGIVLGWRPFGSRPVPPIPIATAAIPLLVAAEIVWLRTRSTPATFALLALSAATVVAYDRAPTFVRPFDRALVRAGEILHLRQLGRWVVRTIVAAAVWVGARCRTTIRWIRSPKDRDTRWMIAAVTTAFTLRLVWVSTMTRTDGANGQLIGDWYSTWNLRIASQFAHGDTPSILGRPTAFWPAGYGALLAPFSWLADHTGLAGPNFMASLLNVVLATLTVVLAGAVAAQWVGAAARLPAAWIMVFAPSHIYVTSAAVPETLLTTLLLATVWTLTRVIRSQAPDTRRASLLAVGLLIGYAMLVGDRASALLLLPFIITWSNERSARNALRATATVLVGVCLVLGVWTIRNGVQVGWWSPTATSVPEGMCAAKYSFNSYELTHTADEALLGVGEDCQRNSPFDDPAAGNEVRQLLPPSFVLEKPNEGAYARRNTRSSLRWFISHPGTLAGRLPMRIYDVGGADKDAGLDFARHFDRTSLGTSFQLQLLRELATAWYYAVVALAFIGLLRVRKVRAAIPIWTVALVMLIQPLFGPYGFSRHYLCAYPFLAILAAGAVGAMSPSSGEEAATDQRAADS